MGFYLRKSVNVGPFKFNLSKSGIGVSTGIKGFRVGTGPRGNYITVGRGGLYYRATLPSGQNANVSPPQNSNHLSEPENLIAPPSSGVGPMVAFESAPASEMQDSSSLALLNELNGKANRPNYWKWTAAASVGLFMMINSSLSSAMAAFVFLALVCLVIYVYIRDTVAKTSVLCYELDGPNEKAFERLLDAFGAVSACSKTWRIDSQGAVHDSKYHAGASSLITRKGATFGKGLPPNVKTNLDVPFVKAATASLYFMPDRILVYSKSGVGAVTYKDLHFNGAPQRFIETDGVPRDAKVVGETWKYVNKKGGPDKRFKDNRKLPIALYEEIKFQSTSGLNEVFQISRHSISELLKNALNEMSEALPS